MPEFIICWDAGYGDEYDVVDCENEEEAQEEAYQRWKEAAENNANYHVIGPATDELIEEYGL